MASEDGVVSERVERYPEGFLLERGIPLAGGGTGVMHACPGCGVGIVRADLAARLEATEAVVEAARAVNDDIRRVDGSVRPMLDVALAALDKEIPRKPERPIAGHPRLDKETQG